MKAISGFISIKLSGLRPDTLRGVLKRPQRTCGNLESMSGFTSLRHIYEPDVALLTLRRATFPRSYPAKWLDYDLVDILFFFNLSYFISSPVNSSLPN